jgi:hypothetical protein
MPEGFVLVDHKLLISIFLSVLIIHIAIWRSLAAGNADKTVQNNVRAGHIKLYNII